MHFPESQLRQMAATASTLQERLDGHFVPVEGDVCASHRRLQRWQDIAVRNRPSGAADSPQHRERKSQPTGDNLQALLGSVELPQGAPLPVWVPLLDEIVERTAEAFNDTKHTEKLKNSARVVKFCVAYGHLYWPVVQLARSKVEHPERTLSLAESAWRGLEEYLYGRISSIASPALHPSFLAFQAVGKSGADAYFSVVQPFATKARSARTEYRQFVLNQGSDGLSGFFLRFPVLARLCSEIVRCWTGFCQEFIQRLHDDADELAARFNGGAPTGVIVDIKAGVSDSHREGRSVLLLTFSSGLHLAYKPRPVQAEALFFDLAREINARAGNEDLAVLAVLDKGAYGWTEFAHHRQTSSKSAARRYYRRAGQLVCLIHWLGGIDCHRENVVAAGEHPVLVDLEALAHPQDQGEAGVDRGVGWPFARSVLRSGLLPLLQLRPNGTDFYENSGLDARIRQPALHPANTWKYVNTDHMSLGLASRHRHHAVHRPVLEGGTLTMRAYTADVLRGYVQMAAMLEGSNFPYLDTWRLQIANSQRRFIKRPTRVYQAILRHSSQPRFLTSGIERSIELQALPDIAPIDQKERALEIESLERLDVPYFELQIGTTDGTFPDRPLASQMEQVRLATQRKLQLSDNAILRLGATTQRAS